MRVIVTRPAAEAHAWVEQLRSAGFDAVACPLIAISAVADPQPVRSAWHELASPPPARAVMFVSANAVRHFFALRPADVAGWPGPTRAWATGPGTHRALLEAGVPPSLVDAPDAGAPQFDSEALWGRVATQVRAGDVVHIVRGAESEGTPTGRDWLADRLKAAGAQVRAVASYVRGMPDAGALVEPRAGDVWLFSSSQAIGNLVALVGARGLDAQLASVHALCTHARIAEAARRCTFASVSEVRPDLASVRAALQRA